MNGIGKTPNFGARLQSTLKNMNRRKLLYLMLLPALLNFIIFHYWPLISLRLAFYNYNPILGLARSKWAGWTNFLNFFESYYFWQVLKNTVVLSVTSILFDFPCAVGFALMLNECRFSRFKNFTQTTSYMPYFVSSVIVVALFKIFLSQDSGMVNDIIAALGGTRVYFFGQEKWVLPVYIAITLWRWLGYDSIIYLASMSSIDLQLYEAAQIDGAGRLSRIWHVTLPGIKITIVLLFIMRLGNILNVAWQELYLMQNDMNVNAAEVIQTFVYKRGLLKLDYSYSTAVGLFQSVIGLLLVLAANKISNKISEISLF